MLTAARDKTSRKDTSATTSRPCSDSAESDGGMAAGFDYARIAPILARLRLGKTPTFSVKYRVGVAVSKELDSFCTFEEIANHFGITENNAYTLAVSALGALACALYLRINTGSGSPHEQQSHSVDLATQGRTFVAGPLR